MRKAQAAVTVLEVFFVLLFAFCVVNFSVKSEGIYDGYVDHWGNEVPAYISNDTWMTPAPSYITGNLVFYGPYAMDATAEYRGIDYGEEGCIGGVSLMSPIDIGKKVWVKVEEEWFGPFCVVDCARRGDMYSIIVFRDEVIEVNFDFAESLGMVTRNPDNTYEVNEWRKENVVVYTENCSGGVPDVFSEEYKNPVDYSDWFLENATYVKLEENVVAPRDNYLYWRTGVTGETYSDFRKYVPCFIFDLGLKNE